MDHNLTAPCPDHHSHVSKILDPRRSNGGKRIAQTIRAILVAPARLSFQPGCGGVAMAVSELDRLKCDGCDFDHFLTHRP